VLPERNRHALLADGSYRIAGGLLRGVRPLVRICVTFEASPAVITVDLSSWPPTIDHVASEQMSRRLRLALDMYEFGERMALANLCRRHPEASDEQIATMLRRWRRERSGAPEGHAVGKPSQRFV
jgi:hypothetical protein